MIVHTQKKTWLIGKFSVAKKTGTQVDIVRFWERHENVDQLKTRQSSSLLLQNIFSACHWALIWTKMVLRRRRAKREAEANGCALFQFVLGKTHEVGQIEFCSWFHAWFGAERFMKKELLPSYVLTQRDCSLWVPKKVLNHKQTNVIFLHVWPFQSNLFLRVSFNVMATVNIARNKICYECENDRI